MARSIEVIAAGAAAALIQDLKDRGMLEDAVVVVETANPNFSKQQVA